MQIQRLLDLKAPDGFGIPAIAVTPSSARQAVVLVHPTGGCKEQMVGIALQLSDDGISSLSLDLGSHGESDGTFGPRVSGEIDAALERLRSGFDLVGCVGVGSGARLALSSSADYVVAIDPPSAGIVPPRRQHFETPFDVLADDLADPAAQFLTQLPPIAPSQRPCLLVVPEDDLASHFLVRQLEPLLARAEARFVSTVSPSYERRLPREWRLLQNQAVVATVCAWAAQTGDCLQQEEQVHV